MRLRAERLDLTQSLPQRKKTAPQAEPDAVFQFSTQRGIVVTNTLDVLTEATADIAMLLILATMRGAWVGQTSLRAGAWKGWAPTRMPGRAARPDVAFRPIDPPSPPLPRAAAWLGAHPNPPDRRFLDIVVATSHATPVM